MEHRNGAHFRVCDIIAESTRIFRLTSRIQLGGGLLHGIVDETITRSGTSGKAVASNCKKKQKAESDVRKSSDVRYPKKHIEKLGFSVLPFVSS